jgi:hypothetical protein
MNSGPTPKWSVPNPYGYAAAIDSIAAIAAPLLAGVSVALAVLVMQREASFGWSTAALILLLLATFGFLAAVQLGFRARQFAVTPPEIEMWWPDADDPHRRSMMQEEQRDHREQFGLWADRASVVYDLGLLALLLGVAVSLVPAGGLADASAGRGVLFALAITGAIAEALWIANTHFWRGL